MPIVSAPEISSQAADFDTSEIIRRLAELLPSQGPITAFAFLNPLQGLESKPFVEVLRKVKELFGCEPFLQESEYRKMLGSGRITTTDLAEILHEDSDESTFRFGGLIAVHDLRLTMLEHMTYPGTPQELHWTLGETDAFRRLRSDISLDNRRRLIQESRDFIRENFAIDKSTQLKNSIPAKLQHLARHRMTREGITSVDVMDESALEPLSIAILWELINLRNASVSIPSSKRSLPIRHRNLLLKITNADSDSLVNETLIRYCAAYLDQGYAQWKLPVRESGFFHAFLSLVSCGGHFSKRWLKPVKREAGRLLQGNVKALDSLEESLQLLGVAAADKEVFLQSSLLALRGWAGMIWQTEVRPDRVFVPSPDGTLIEFLAVRLLLERHAIQWTASQQLGYTGSLAELGEHLRDRLSRTQRKHSIAQRSYPVFQLAQLHGWTPQMLLRLSDVEWEELVTEIAEFSTFERRRVFHFAFERRLSREALSAISIRAQQPRHKIDRPQMQVVTCIDAREESFRRHLEEVAPNVETFGNAGFFCIPMYYRGSADAHFAALCPIVIKPKHWVVEEVIHSLADSHRQRAAARRVLGSASHQFNTGTRNSFMGAVFTAVLGPLFTVPLVGRILFPRLTARMHRTARGLVAPPPVTRLRLERAEGVPPSPTEEGIGFTLSEMVNLAERSLRDIGLTSQFSRFVIFLGHGSNCLNNPHESAYHCGACSGSPGGANGRALAAMLNDRRVRKQLDERGIVIPDETHFLGAQHNTATEEITFFDLELLPTSHIQDFHKALDILSQVAERNAHERCRRFESASLEFTPLEALHHVQDRAEDLAQTRPEYGNSTNAVCFVGRRSRIRGLYLDRRSFLMSYDSSADATGAILARILGAVIPVCEGINMLYTLSAIDSRGWGCGTKLPHNITSLLGVMDGAASDLRPGLPWQGVDIHEPVRLLFVIESSAEVMLQVMNENPLVGNICRNEWSQIAVLDPETSHLQVFRGGKFVDFHPTSSDIPVSRSSCECYRGKRANLPFTLIRTSS